MELLIATTNPGKVREYRAILTGLNCIFLGLSDLGITQDVAETGSSYAENAALKAREYAALSGRLTLADDSGLEVDALAGRPGVYSARYAPDSTARIQKLLNELRAVANNQRTARFQCVIALAQPDGRLTLAAGTCEGRIALEAKGVNGFGFDPVFYLPEYQATMAELPEGVKNMISHRARAAQQLRPILAGILDES